MSKVSRLFAGFFHSEKSGGFVLICCTLVSLIIANSGAGENYFKFWHQQVGFETESVHLKHSLEFWVNDGLMAVFFLLVGLEIERELYIGALSSVKNALLPVFAAIGGMIAPATIHFMLNQGTNTQSGYGIPMATDIAFALGILSLIGKSVPVTLKIFLTAFAIIDDIGAILVIAIFYTKSFSLLYFGLAMCIWGLLFVMNRLKIHRLAFYIVPGIVMWYFMLQSGVHATVSGILFAFALPFGNGDENTSSARLQNFLHKPVAFIILPIFALANTGVGFASNWFQQLASQNSVGIIVGLVMGKPVGILLFSYLAVKCKVSKLADDINWKQILGAGILGGIGFTMSIFITLLAFSDETLVADSKMAVLISSLIAGFSGLLFLKLVSRNKTKIPA